MTRVKSSQACMETPALTRLYTLMSFHERQKCFATYSGRNYIPRPGFAHIPTNFMLIAAMDPCPCGWFGDSVKECTDTLGQVTRYQNRINGPLRDRIDAHVEVPRVDYEKLSSDRNGELSARIRERVEPARERQRVRLAGTKLQ